MGSPQPLPQALRAGALFSADTGHAAQTLLCKAIAPCLISVKQASTSWSQPHTPEESGPLPNTPSLM